MRCRQCQEEALLTSTLQSWPPQLSLPFYMVQDISPFHHHCGGRGKCPTTCTGEEKLFGRGNVRGEYVRRNISRRKCPDPSIVVSFTCNLACYKQRQLKQYLGSCRQASLAPSYLYKRCLLTNWSGHARYLETKSSGLHASTHKNRAVLCPSFNSLRST